MTKKNQSRAAKMVLASLLAVSLSAPSFATSTFANTNESAAVAVAEQTGKTVAIQTFKPGTTDLQPAISSHLASDGKVTKKGKGYEGQVTVVAKSASMITGMQTKQGSKFVDAAEVINEDGTITYSFPVVEGKALVSKLHVVVAEFDMDVWYDFDLKMGEAKVEEKPEAVAVAKTFGVQVYKDGTTEESTMKDYVEPTVEITKTSAGHSVTMTIKKNQEQYIHGFKVADKEAVKATKNGKRTYTFDVANTTSKANAELHVIVDAYGVKYDQNHKVQFGFNSNPFTDINKDGNKDAIIALFEKEIIKGNAKFNPANKINRSQFALMIYRALEMEPTKDAGFKDIANLSDNELKNAINALANAGIVQKANKFNPTNTLTRSQGALMLYRAVNVAAGTEVDAGDASLSYYVDGKTITNAETKKAFGFLYNNNIMTGSPTADGKKAINAASSLSRSQMAKILNGSLNFIDEN